MDLFQRTSGYTQVFAIPGSGPSKEQLSAPGSAIMGDQVYFTYCALLKRAPSQTMRFPKSTGPPEKMHKTVTLIGALVVIINCLKAIETCITVGNMRERERELLISF